MDVSAIRNEVEAALKHEAETGTLREIILDAIRRAEPGRMDAESLAARGAEVIGEFVSAAPTVIEATMQAAEEAGVAESVRPIFETAISYIHEEVDFIPDSLGLVGMLDDAYLIHGLMQEISDRHRVMTGRRLLPSATFGDMQEIKRLIGDPTATRLDVAIVAFARRQNVKETIEQILGRIGGGGLVMDLPASVSMPRSGGVLSELPGLDLGAIRG